MPPFFMKERNRLKSKERAEKNYLLWQLVFIGGLSYRDVSKMSYEEIYEAFEAMIMIKDLKVGGE